MAVLCTITYTPAVFGEEKLYSDSFDNGGEEWNMGNAAQLIPDDTGSALSLSGKDNLAYIGDGEFKDLTVYADVKSVQGSGYVGVALRIKDSNRYELRVYPKAGNVKIVKKTGNGESVIAEQKSEMSADGFKMGFSAKGQYMRGYIDDAVVVAAYDEMSDMAGAAAIISDDVNGVIERADAYKEYTWFSENYDSGRISSFSDKEMAPVITSSGNGQGFDIVTKDGVKALANTNAEETARIIYPCSNEGDLNQAAVIATVNAGDGWTLSCEEGGFSIFSRYQALNKTYKLSVENNCFVIRKIMIAENRKLASSDAMEINADNYHEIAFETLNNEDGTVNLRAYLDGQLKLSAVDDNIPYTTGRFGIEKAGSAEVYIDSLDVTDVDSENDLEERYAKESRKTDITFTWEGEAVTPEVKPWTADNQVMLSVKQMAELLGAEYIDKGGSAELSRDGLSVKLTEKSADVTINGSKSRMPVAVSRTEGVLTAPAEYVLGLFGAMTAYDKDNMTFAVTYDETVLKDTTIYTKDGSVLATSKDGLYFRFAKVSGAEGFFRAGTKSPKSIWRAYFIDNETAAANIIPEEPAKGYYGTNWVLGNCYVESKDAVLEKIDWDNTSGKLSLTYTHKDVDVTANFVLMDGKIEMWADVTNKQDYVLQFITMPTEWSLCYSDNSNILLPTSYAMMEYDTVSWFRYVFAAVIMDGVATTGDNGVISVYNIQHEQRDGDDEYIMATDTQIYGGDFTRSIRFRPGTVVYREKGESVSSVHCAMAANKDMRAMADDYVNTCYPNSKKVIDKIQDEQDKETVPKSNVFHLSTIGNKFTDLTKVVKKMPGHSMFHMTAVLGLTNKAYSYWDAFPNYFPPYEGCGTQEEFAEVIRTAREEGHSYLPRNSLFYGTEGSLLDKRVGIENLAIRHFDGGKKTTPQKAVWGVPGWLYSPASKQAMEFFSETFDTWKSMGANNFFTNVITVMNPMKHRYDFHPDAERPDWEYDYQAKVMRWHGERAPLYSEGLDISRLPYQAGFMTDARWDPAYDPCIGVEGAIRTRYDIPALMISEYAKIFSHNVSDENQNSNRALTFSLLYNYGLKMRLNIAYQPSEDNLRWIRGQAILNELVLSRLYGQRLEEEIDYDSQLQTANYGGNIVLGNLENNPVKMEGYTISKEGFEFKSADGKVNAGIYDKYNNHELEQSTLLLFEKTDAGQRIYAPVTDRDITLNVPSDGMTNPKITAHYADGSSAELEGIFDGQNIQFVYPVLPLSDGEPLELDNGVVIEMSKVVPYIEITNDGGNKISKVDNSVNISVSIPFEKYSRLLNIPECVNGTVVVENPSSAELNGTVRVKGKYLGANVDLSYEVNTSEKRIAFPMKLTRTPFSTDTGVSLTVEQSGLGSAKIQTPSIGASGWDWSMLESTDEIAETVDNLYVDWNIAANDALPEGFTKTLNGGTNSYGEALALNKGDTLILESTKLMTANVSEVKKLFYAEMMIKFTDFTKYVYKNGMSHNIMSAEGSSGNPILLQYNAFDQCFNLKVTPQSGSPITTKAAKPELKLNEWYHVVIEINGETQRLTVNGITTETANSAGYSALTGKFIFGGTTGFDTAYMRIGN